MIICPVVAESVQIFYVQPPKQSARAFPARVPTFRRR